jgi:tyrosyl-tRNA synthetase
MTSSAFDVLKERGFIAQLTHEKEIAQILKDKKVVFYTGFDPTADSLHVGSLIPIMTMAHFQKHGHTPIVLVGGGTALIGDPTGKEEMRQLMTQETINTNIARIKDQIAHFIEFKDDRAIMVNNGDWIRSINYVDFLRNIGKHFSVNRMLTAECFKLRLEKGLSFLEFNYMLLQAYDFLLLHQKYNCTLQVGGDDQWSNILAGVDLIRRKEQKEAFGMTINLITTSDGKKMGKTEKGAVWLSPEKTSPYEYYQYWRNTHDGDVKKFLYMFTFLEKGEIEKLGALKDSEINEAKKVLAFEATKLLHGAENAKKAKEAARQLFEFQKGEGGAVPTTELKLSAPVQAVDLFLSAGIISSKTEGRKLIGQSGLSVNGKVVKANHTTVSRDDADEQGIIILKKGKKTYHHIKVV